MSNKYKHDHNRKGEERESEILLHIANELAEKNRLKRLELEMKFRTQANRSLYRTYKSPDGKQEFQVPPEQKQKDDWKEEIKAINKELSDHAVEIDDQETESET